MVVAVSTAYVDVWADPSICRERKRIQVWYDSPIWGQPKGDGGSVTVEVVDTCRECPDTQLGRSFLLLSTRYSWSHPLRIGANAKPT